MKRRIANALIRWARRLDPNSCLDWHALPHAGRGVVKAEDLADPPDLLTSIRHHQRQLKLMHNQAPQ